jgi:hypothetical protein
MPYQILSAWQIQQVLHSGILSPIQKPFSRFGASLLFAFLLLLGVQLVFFPRPSGYIQQIVS